jgi:hypothetical protein
LTKAVLELYSPIDLMPILSSLDRYPLVAHLKHRVQLQLLLPVFSQIKAATTAIVISKLMLLNLSLKIAFTPFSKTVWPIPMTNKAKIKGIRHWNV